MVRMRKASHHATRSCTAEPVAHNTVPTSQHAAASASVNVNNAVWRRKMSIDAASNTPLPAMKSPGATAVAPAIAATHPAPARSGPAYAQ